MEYEFNKYRTNTCIEINKSFISKKVKIAGWIRTKRDHGGILFLDIYDHSGMIQCTIHPEHSGFSQIEDLKVESVISVLGEVVLRDDQNINKNIPSGEIELIIESFNILSSAEILPFALHQEDLNEELQLSYRFLYLRTPEMQKILKLRTDVINFLRNQMNSLGFQEIQTPLLASPSPEGARDYVVPSRMHPGKFYALPQAPQQFKQLLMASGVSKYFQIAPCFRDEDSRADRLIGEFYQLDFEMAFAQQEDVLNVLQSVLSKTFKEFSDAEIEDVFPRIPYTEAIETYGTDKPDLRNPLKIFDITDIQEAPDILKPVVEKGGRLLTVSVKMDYNNNELKKLTKVMMDKGAKGLAYCYLKDGSWTGPLSKMLSTETLKQATQKDDHNLLFLIADTYDISHKLSGMLITELGNMLNLINKNDYKFCFITDFPMFEKTDGVWDFMHNPFSMPQDIDLPLGEILSYQYDVVCNGYEITSGAVRNHNLNLIHKVFSLIGQDASDLESRFPVFKSFKYGVPPHAGAAPGIDRIIMLLSKKSNVRDIVAFPMNQKGENLLMESPCFLDEKFLKEIAIKTLDNSK
ncbi:aspartate--tRNA ligase [Alphaproteobacteria bacterium endosymbiont of Tiliacea citrago]|uniref:aspartate--tRNA ligase n=1 Tax=Alphaproteobacteria bacterium endosymbiont of Tiliacea citrago TaxID=3077944 RepID=UPI00313BDC94